MSFSTHPPSPPDPFSSQKPTKNPFLSEAPLTALGEEPKDWSIDAWPVASPPRDSLGEPVLLSSHEVSLEVVITWGHSVLAVTHLSPPRPFVIGTSDGAGALDIEVPEAALGLLRFPVVFLQGEAVSCVVPEHASGSYRDESGTHTLSEFLASSVDSTELARARQTTLPLGARVHMHVGEIGVHLHLSKKAAAMPRGFSASLETASVGYFGLTAGLCAALMLSMAYFAPPLGLEEDQALQMKRQILLGQYLDALSEREKKAEEIPDLDTGAEASGETGKRAEGNEGEAGKEDAPRVSARAAVSGPRDNTQLQIPRSELIELAKNFGMNELLGADSAIAAAAWTNPLGGTQLLGNMDVTAQGNMWGDAIGESGGSNGLGLLGKDFGGGALYGNGLGIGLGRDGVIGPGLGREGMGRSNALTKGGHKVRSPSMVGTGVTSVNGRLPPEVIQRTVRQNFGRFRMCYEAGLRQNPSLEGRIPVRFIIGSDGAVSNVSSPGGFADAGVQSCVLSAFYGLSFPSPEGGIVTVTYPLIFSPE